MADLPDLDTTNITYLAYWNAIDQGNLLDIDPTEVVSYGAVTDYSIYDNGVQGILDLSQLLSNGTGTGGFRVKEDGWFVAWLTSNATTGFLDQSSVVEQTNADIMYDWTSPGSGADPTQNTAERAINGLMLELSNSSGVTYNSGDVGLYAYHEDGDVLTIAAIGDHVGEGSFSKSASFSFTSSTTVVDAWISGAIYSDGALNGSYGNSQYTTDQGTTITFGNHSGYNNPGSRWGAIDVIARDYISSASQDVQADASGDNTGAGSDANANVGYLWK